MTVVTHEEPHARGMFTRASLFRIGVLMGALGTMMIGLKLMRYAKLSGVFGWATTAVLLRQDLAFLLVSSLLFLLWIDVGRGWFRKLGLVSLHLFVFFCMILVAVEHGFFMITGTIGDWSLLKYTFTRFDELQQVIQSQLKLRNVLLLLLPILLNLLPIYLGRIGIFARWIQHRPRSRYRQPLVVFSAGVLLTLSFMMLYRSSLANDVRLLDRNLFWHIAVDATMDVLSTPTRHNKVKGPLLFQTRRLAFKPTPQTRRMNVVIVMLESTRAQSTTPYNKKMDTTPFLNDLAKRSLMVKQMYPVIPHTSKALVSVLCGFPPKIDMPIVAGQNQGIPGRCLANLLKPLGYNTAFFQTATRNFEDREQMVNNMGYQFFRSHETLPKSKFERTHYFGYEDKAMLEPSLKWVDKAVAKKKPFFLTYLTLTTHHGYETPKGFQRRKYKVKNKELERYLNALRYQDQFVKEMFEGFKKRGLIDNTLFVLVGDHGEAFNEHKRRQHDNGLWEEILHIPAFIYNPKLFPVAKPIEGLRQQTDIVPTVADALNLRVENGKLAGKSLLKDVPKDRQLHFSCWYKRYCLAIRQGPMKYIYNYKRRTPEVYDLRNDKTEKRSLYKNPKHKKKLHKLSKQMLQWRDHINAIYETPSDENLEANVTKIRPKTEVKFDIRFGNYISFVGYTLRTQKVDPEGRIDLTLVYKCLRPIPRGWQLFLHGHVIRPKRFFNFNYIPLNGTYPLQRWKAGEYIKDRYRFRLDRKVPPGVRFRINLGMWAPRKGRQPILNAQGRPHLRGSLLVVEIPVSRKKSENQRFKYKRRKPPKVRSTKSRPRDALRPAPTRRQTAKPAQPAPRAVRGAPVPRFFPAPVLRPAIPRLLPLRPVSRPTKR